MGFTLHLTVKIMRHAAFTLTLTLVSHQTRGLFIPESQAKSMIFQHRSKRANGFLEEIRRGSNAERECAREDCVFEEYRVIMNKRFFNFFVGVYLLNALFKSRLKKTSTKAP